MDTNPWPFFLGSGSIHAVCLSLFLPKHVGTYVRGQESRARLRKPGSQGSERRKRASRESPRSYPFSPPLQTLSGPVPNIVSTSENSLIITIINCLNLVPFHTVNEFPLYIMEDRKGKEEQSTMQVQPIPGEDTMPLDRSRSRIHRFHGV